MVMLFLAEVNNNCNYYSGYSGLSVVGGGEERGWMVWRRRPIRVRSKNGQGWKRMTKGWRKDEGGEKR